MTLEPKPGGFIVRLRYGRDAQGKPARDRFLIATKDEQVAADIEIRMTAAAHTLSKLHHPKAQDMLTQMGKAAGDAKAFRAFELVVQRLAMEAAHGAPAVTPSGPVTFAQVVDEWTSGKLREKHPDSPAVRSKMDRGRKIDRATLTVFLPALGNKAMSEITGEDIDKAKRLIPAELDPDTRRLYLLRLRSVFRLARKPLKLITTVPEEVEDLPPLKPRNLFWFLYPEEEAQLLACRKIPLCYRVLYAWLMRNGTRIHETLLLTHDHLDLKRGRVHFEAEWTKTKRARFWDLEQDVFLAMKAYFEIDKRPQGDKRVFHSTKGDTLHQVTVQERFLSDLLLAGIDRRELHQTTKGSRKLRVHDSRASFCTMARRRGMPDSWIMDRSGHESAAQLEKYSRFVRHADEQGIARWFADMSEAIPEIRAYLHEMGQGWAKPKRESQKQASPAHVMHSMTESLTDENQAKTPAKAPSVSAETPLPPTSGPAENKGVGQTGPSGPGQGEVGPEPTEDTPERALVRIEEGLERSLSVALEKGWLEIANKILGELSERRRARSAPGVPSLSDARRKREEKP